MATAAHDPVRVYHQPLWGRTDPELRRSLVGAAVAGVLTLAAVFLAPQPAPTTMTIEQVPERLARLILDKPQAPAAAPAPAHAPEQARPAVPTPAPKPEAAPQTAPRTAPPRPRTAARRDQEPAPPQTGTAGRERARTEVAASLGQTRKSLDKALDGLAAALPTAADAGAAPAPRRRGRGHVRGGRDAGELGKVGGGVQVATADLGGSALAVEGVTIGGIDGVVSDGPAAASAGSGTGGGGLGGVGGGGAPVRSDESLLAVVRRYAPAIQFCYENELKKQPGLRGKVIVALTVAADGSVSAVRVVEDGLAAPAVLDCALAQMRAWRFAAVDGGAATFQVPFLFTPPE